MKRSARSGQAGQGALEVIAAVPLLVIAALAAWQLVAVIGAGFAATERARAEAIAHHSGQGVARFEARVRVPGVLPFGGRLSVSARAVTRRP